MSKIDKIKKYFDAVDLDFNSKEEKSRFFKNTAQRFGVSWQTVVGIYVAYIRAHKPNSANFVQVEGTKNPEFTLTTTSSPDTKFRYLVNETLGEATVEIMEADMPVKSLEDLIIACEIDTDKWDVALWKCDKKETVNSQGTHTLYNISAKLTPRKLDKDLRKQKEHILSELKNEIATKPVVSPAAATKTAAGDCVLEISIPDLHIGKFSWGKETGEDYDIKIAVQRYNDAVDELLSRTNLSLVDRILLPIGNDMINIDNKSNTTTGGTPQSTDSRFGKMFQAAKNLLISTIDRLTAIAHVDVVVVPGNHDNVTMFTLGEVLDAYYHKNENVTVDNSAKQRKYYQYGINGLMFTHGNEEKHSELGLIFATEEPKLWAATKIREVHLGHFHKTKKTQYVSVDEFQGFKVRTLPSLSGTDSWHYSKGYNSLKSAQAFLYHKTKGLIAEYTHTV